MPTAITKATCLLPPYNIKLDDIEDYDICLLLLLGVGVGGLRVGREWSNKKQTICIYIKEEGGWGDKKKKKRRRREWADLAAEVIKDNWYWKYLVVVYFADQNYT